MKRRGFLSTLLLPFLPTPDLPMERFGRFPIHHVDIRIISITKPSRRLELNFVVDEQVVHASVNTEGMKRLQLWTK